MWYLEKNEEPKKIKLINQTIPYEESIELFEITLDNRLNKEELVDKVRAKAKGAFNSL